MKKFNYLLGLSAMAFTLAFSSCSKEDTDASMLNPGPMQDLRTQQTISAPVSNEAVADSTNNAACKGCQPGDGTAND